MVNSNSIVKQGDKRPDQKSSIGSCKWKIQAAIVFQTCIMFPLRFIRRPQLTEDYFLFCVV